MVGTGDEKLDPLFSFEPVINCVYGKAASGKTTLSLMASINMAKGDKKVLFVDTENSFDIERAKQIGGNDPNILNNIMVVKCCSFDEQCRTVENLMMIKDMLSLVVVDSVNVFYRQELQEKKDPNPKMSRHLGNLAELGRNGIPVIVTAQVYSTVEDDVCPVGGNMLMNWSPCIIELDQTGDKRRLILKKHPKVMAKEVDFEIKNEGLVIG